MDRLLDQAKIKGAQDFKHKVELMYRSSHTNEDRSRILLFNNPLPNLNNWAGDESCGRYMPSWSARQAVCILHAYTSSCTNISLKISSLYSSILCSQFSLDVYSGSVSYRDISVVSILWLYDTFRIINFSYTIFNIFA